MRLLIIVTIRLAWGWLQCSAVRCGAVRTLNHSTARHGTVLVQQSSTPLQRKERPTKPPMNLHFPHLTPPSRSLHLSSFIFMRLTTT
ncbi:hypothetical protein BU24DRAFT_426709 [Aaosphaeria arxii CBS 175.79]|uniref:Secreted protein n=1 Tax=Aaosphaeria arxii CBS 175.79 TaxID=1450172 RepID=A0A6A5XGZ6_9PLEO|nr:uncharacterized protein BU24DRAFT_426709 [Aaosphaeria arxii CBS 175.79]KAF2011634.1 hypothetical protein BU24DRAFT_426709 [Aaosphaeria arxii CBS 175.79]